MALLRKPARPRLAPEDPDSFSLDCVSLSQALQGPDASVRRRAAADLAHCANATSCLLERLQQEPLESVRQVIITSLTRIGSEQALLGLSGCLRSENVPLRNNAIEAIKQMPEKMAPVLEQLLLDSDADVRIFAVNILETLRHEQLEPWLIRIISHDQHINVICSALDLLCEMGGHQALPALQDLKIRYPEEGYIQFTCDLAIHRILSLCNPS
jgi:HEAT repeat protein